VVAVACKTHHDSGGPAAFASIRDQVAHGRTLFAQHCAKCHGPSGEGKDAPRLVGLAQGALPLDPPPSRKVRESRFVTAADVAEFVVANMPPKKAGSLTTDEYLAVLAFALDANGMRMDAPLTMARADDLVIPR
jgi:cytochrome c